VDSSFSLGACPSLPGSADVDLAEALGTGGRIGSAGIAALDVGLVGVAVDVVGGGCTELGVVGVLDMAYSERGS
jgi:hypothetical protein